jgi:hypothetical protein
MFMAAFAVNLYAAKKEETPSLKDTQQWIRTKLVNDLAFKYAQIMADNEGEVYLTRYYGIEYDGCIARLTTVTDELPSYKGQLLEWYKKISPSLLLEGREVKTTEFDLSGIQKTRIGYDGIGTVLGIAVEPKYFTLEIYTAGEKAVKTTKKHTQGKMEENQQYVGNVVFFDSLSEEHLKKLEKAFLNAASKCKSSYNKNMF